MRVHESSRWLTVFLDKNDWKYNKALIIIGIIKNTDGAIRNRRKGYWSLPNTAENKNVIRICIKMMSVKKRTLTITDQ